MNTGFNLTKSQNKYRDARSNSRAPVPTIPPPVRSGQHEYAFTQFIIPTQNVLDILDDYIGNVSTLIMSSNKNNGERWPSFLQSCAVVHFD